jgi:hypothetical protein
VPFPFPCEEHFQTHRPPDAEISNKGQPVKTEIGIELRMINISSISKLIFDYQEESVTPKIVQRGGKGVLKKIIIDIVS